jgi:hypothetical protein
MPKLGEAGPEERTICILDFDYGAVTQVLQVFPGRQLMFESKVEKHPDFNLNVASKRKKNR